MQCKAPASLTSLQGLDQYANMLELVIHGCGPPVLQNSTFSKLASLVKLNISHNGVYAMEEYALDGLKKLETLDLSFNHITQLSKFPSLSSLQSLFLDNNYIQRLGSTTFDSLIAVQTFSIANNNIESVNNKVLLSLILAVSINLSGNKLKEIFNNALPKDKLEILDLSNNVLKDIEGDIFMLPKLKHLILHHNQISTLSIPAVVKSLKYLDLSNNKLQSIPSAFVEVISGSKIQKCLLGGNPLHCNCIMEPFRIFVQSHLDVFNDGNVYSYPTCQSPNKLFVHTATDVSFRCMSPTIKIIQTEGKILCNVNGDPPPKVTWFNDVTGKSLLELLPPEDISETFNSAILQQSALLPETTYTCQGSNMIGETNQTCIVIIRDKKVDGHITEFSSLNGSITLPTLIGAVVGTFVLTVLLVLLTFLCCRYTQCCRNGENGSIPKSKISTWNTRYKKKKSNNFEQADLPPHFDNRRRRVDPPPKSQDGEYAEIPVNNAKQKSKSKSAERQTPYIEELPSSARVGDQASVRLTQLLPQSGDPIHEPEPPRVEYINLQPPMMHFTSNPIHHPQQQQQMPHQQQQQPVYLNQPPLSPTTIDSRAFGHAHQGYDRVRIPCSSQPRATVLVAEDLFNSPRASFQGVRMNRTQSFTGYGSELDV